MRRLIFTSAFIGLLVLPHILGAQEEDHSFDPNTERAEPDFGIHIGRLIIGYSPRLYEDITDQIFNELSTYDIGVPIGEFTSVVGKVRRSVYDNQDGTYSVADVFGVQGIVSPSKTKIIGGDVPAYAAVGAEVQLDFVNIRQADSKLKIGYKPEVMIPDDPWYKDLWYGIKWVIQIPIHLLNETFNQMFRVYRSPNEEYLARYEDYLNMVTTPFKLPLDLSGFAKMEPGEIMSYTVLGGAFIPIGVGWKQVPFTADFGLSFYWRGAFRITVLKERDGNFARVRFTVIDMEGRSLGGKIRGKWTLFEGIAFGSDVSTSITPLSVSVSKSWIDTTHRAYRYDMRTEDGVSAYEKAVYADFTAPLSSGVQWLYKRHEITDSTSRLFAFDALILRHRDSYQLNNSKIQISDADGMHHVFNSVSQSELRNGSFFRGNRENVQFFVESTMGMESPDPPVRGIDPVIMAKVMITDKDTYGDEFKEYAHIVETILQDPYYLDEGAYYSDREYGRLSIDYHVDFPLLVVDRIVNASDRDWWRALARAFHVREEDWSTQEARDDFLRWDHYVMGFLGDRRSVERVRLLKDAQKIVDYFKFIREEEDDEQKVRKIAEFHQETRYQWELLSVMLALSRYEDIYAFLHLYGSRFEEKKEVWGEDLGIERPNLHDVEQNQFEGRSALTPYVVYDLQLSQPEKKDPFRLILKTDQDPSKIDGFWFLINRMKAGWFRTKQMYVTQNDDELLRNFVVVQNGILVLPLDKLINTDELEEGEQYEMLFAFKSNDGTWSLEKNIVFEYGPSHSMKIVSMRPEEPK